MEEEETTQNNRRYERAVEALKTLQALGLLEKTNDPAEAAENFRAWYLDKPKNVIDEVGKRITSLILEVFFDISPIELLADETGLGRSGAYQTKRQYESTDESINELRSHVQTKGISGSTRERIAAMAESLVGQREQGGQNQGAIVALVSAGNRTGDPWCGGFTNFIMDQVHPGLFDQRNFMRARSFETVAKNYNRDGFDTWREKNHAPQVGDVIVFNRGGGGKGHVGIVTSVEDGQVTYVSGNDQNAVRERSFSLTSPPSQLLGYVDVEALASARNINLDRALQTAPQHPSGLPAELVAQVTNAGMSLAA